MFAWLVFVWMLLRVAQDLVVWPSDRAHRTAAVGRCVVALLVLLVLLGVAGRV